MEVTAYQKKMFHNIHEASKDLYEDIKNSLLVGDLKDKKYLWARDMILDENKLAKELFRRSTTYLYQYGIPTNHSRTSRNELKKLITEVGEEWIKEMCEKVVEEIF